jgi:hypothetical protein
MFCNHKQVGRSRVNKLREGKKNPPSGRILCKDDKYVQLKPRSDHTSYKSNEKQIGQIKKTSMTGLDKLYQHQMELFKQGLSLKEYENYIQGKINKDKYYYKSLSDSDITGLHKNYRVKVLKKQAQKLEQTEMSKQKKKQKQAYKEKKHSLNNMKKQEVINQLLTELKKTKALGVSNNAKSLNITPSNWNAMKNFLFNGGRYIEGHDKDWVKIYTMLV